MRLLATIMLIAACLAPAVRADDRQRMEMAGLAGSERLRLRAWGDALTAGNLPQSAMGAMRQDLLRQGYYSQSGRAETVVKDLWAAPLLAWDGNINGGVLQDRFTAYGLVFQADPAFTAKSGLVGGASAGGTWRLAWGNGRLIELRGMTELGWSPRHHIGRADATLAVCSRNTLTDWHYLDFCALGSRFWRQLDDGSSHQLSATYSTVFAGPESLHQIGLGYVSASTSGADQDRAVLRLESVWNHAVTEIGVTLGRPLPGTTVLRSRLEAAIRWRAKGRAWGMDLWRQEAAGSAFIGIPRADRIIGIGIETEIRPGTRLRLGYLDSDSTAGIADYSQISLDLRFDRLRW